MNRRQLMLLLGAAAAGPRSLQAQQKAMPVIGYLNSGATGPFAPFLAAFHHGLGETGYAEGQNVAVEYRSAEGSYDRLPALAADLVRRNVDLIFASGVLPAVLAAKMLLRQSRSSSPATMTRSQRGWSPVSPALAVM